MDRRTTDCQLVRYERPMAQGLARRQPGTDTRACLLRLLYCTVILVAVLAAEITIVSDVIVYIHVYIVLYIIRVSSAERDQVRDVGVHELTGIFCEFSIGMVAKNVT